MGVREEEMLLELTGAAKIASEQPGETPRLQAEALGPVAPVPTPTYLFVHFTYIISLNFLTAMAYSQVTPTSDAQLNELCTCVHRVCTSQVHLQVLSCPSRPLVLLLVCVSSPRPRSDVCPHPWGKAPFITYFVTPFYHPKVKSTAKP